MGAGPLRPALIVLLALALVCAPAGEAAADSGAVAQASAVKRCKTVRVKLKRGGKVVLRNGRPVFRRVRRCRLVASPGCRFVRQKKRRNGKVVKRNGKPVYVKVERCPPKPKPKPPGPDPDPDPGPGPGPGPDPGPGPAEALANRVLAMPQGTPHNIGLFTSVFERDPQADIPGLYPTGSAMAPAPGPPPDEDAVRTRLTSYLNRYFGNDTASIASALALFDDADLKALCEGNDDEDATLRAAIAASKGTVYEPAIEYGLRDNHFQLFGYNPLPQSTFIAASTGGGETDRVAFVNQLYQAESFEYLIGVMGHEFMHHNFGTPRAEEAILNSLSAMGYMQVLSAAPELAHSGTELARNTNDLALVFINSREAGSPDSEIYAPTGLGVAPDSVTDAIDMWTVFQGNSTTGAAPAELREILVNLLEPGAAIPATADYSQATAELFEHLGDTWLTDVERAQISVLLQLVTVEEIVAATGLPEQQVVDTLGLQPYLDAIP